MSTAYKKIESLKHLNELIGQGFKIHHDDRDKSKWFCLKGHDTYYVPATIRREAPEMFGGAPVLSDKLLPGHHEDDETAKLEALNIVEQQANPPKQLKSDLGGIETQTLPSDHSRTAPTTPNLPVKAQETAPELVKEKEIAKIQVRQPEPGNYIAPSEFVLHETPRRILESIWFQEGLHTVEKEKRHELAFARIELDAKGKPILVDDAPSAKGGKETLFSLADLAVYRLAEIYSKWKKLEPDVIAMKENIIALSIENTFLANEIDIVRNEKNMMLQSAFLVSLSRRK